MNVYNFAMYAMLALVILTQRLNSNLQPQIRKSWNGMENANKKESSDL